jgi:hypothetical protein
VNHDLPLGTIHVIGTDVGIKGAVVVVVDGKEVCMLAPSDVQPHMTSLMGRMSVTMTFPDGHVVLCAGSKGGNQ